MPYDGSDTLLQQWDALFMTLHQRLLPHFKRRETPQRVRRLLRLCAALSGCGAGDCCSACASLGSLDEVDFICEPSSKYLDSYRRCLTTLNRAWPWASTKGNSCPSNISSGLTAFPACPARHPSGPSTALPPRPGEGADRQGSLPACTGANTSLFSRKVALVSLFRLPARKDVTQSRNVYIRVVYLCSSTKSPGDFYPSADRPAHQRRGRQVQRSGLPLKQPAERHGAEQLGSLASRNVVANESQPGSAERKSKRNVAINIPSTPPCVCLNEHVLEVIG
jgi:hypothetical protein